jgi:hypothetical protein
VEGTRARRRRGRRWEGFRRMLLGYFLGSVLLIFLFISAWVLFTGCFVHCLPCVLCVREDGLVVCPSVNPLFYVVSYSLLSTVLI